MKSINPLSKSILLLSVLSLAVACKNEKKLSMAEEDASQKELPVLETGSQKPMPEAWIDKDTHHKVIKLTQREGNNRSFYFHNNPFLPTKDGEGSLMVFYGDTDNGNQLFTVNLDTKEIEQITHKPGNKRGEIVGVETRKVYYKTNDSIFSTDIDTHEDHFVYKFPEGLIGSASTLNADEKLLGGVIITKEEQEIFNKNPDKSDYFNKIYEAKLERSLVTIDIASGKLQKFFTEDAWLNHEQFSPVDPDLFMYCHEGPWHKVDRIWTMDINKREPHLMHKRTVNREIAGHEFFSPDGKTIWFDLQIPRGETFYLAGKNIETGKETRYALKRNEWSIHYNISPDMKTFAGDGGDESQVAHAKDGQWIYHFTPQGDSLSSEKLVNMAHHNYELEPNVHFSPDGKWIIFRANFEGKTNVYAVALQKENI